MCVTFTCLSFSVGIVNFATIDFSLHRVSFLCKHVVDTCSAIGSCTEHSFRILWPSSGECNFPLWVFLCIHPYESGHTEGVLLCVYEPDPPYLFCHIFSRMVCLLHSTCTWIAIAKQIIIMRSSRVWQKLNASCTCECVKCGHGLNDNHSMSVCRSLSARHACKATSVGSCVWHISRHPH